MKALQKAGMDDRGFWWSDRHEETISAARQKQLADTDKMSPELRQCVHEFGLPIVTACLLAKVTEPKRIRQLVHEVWAGARQVGQRCRPEARQQNVVGALDWLLLQVGATISAATLVRFLRGHSYTIVPLEPTNEMVAASVAEVATFTERVTKSEKHRRRLRAALRKQAETVCAPVKVGRGEEAA